MPTAELPPSVPGPDDDARHAPAEVSLALPEELRGWVPALSLWGEIDELRFKLTARALGAGMPADWGAFVARAETAGLLQPASAPGRYLFRAEWAAALSTAMERVGEPAELQRLIVDAWLADPLPGLVEGVLGWARDLRRWEVVEECWMVFNAEFRPISQEMLVLFRDLPAEARRTRPFLTWASGAAAAALPAATQAPPTEAAIQQLLHDSALLHADWVTREDTDVAVSAGSYRMLGERRLPSPRPGQALAAAWRTKLEVDALIDSRSRVGQPPSRRTQAIFRAFSARLAIARGDGPAALSEARWATILADWQPVAMLARGLEALAETVIAESSPVFEGDLRVEGIDPYLGPRGFRGMGQIFILLSEAHSGFRSLDRPALDRALGLVPPEAAALDGVWSVRASAEAFRDALWGDPDEGLSRLFSEIARESLMGREQDEPLGGTLLALARLLLLTKSGAFGAAANLLELVPSPLRTMPQARLHLWAGELQQAVQVAQAGAYREGLGTSDRSKLALIRCSARLLEGSADGRVANELVRELRTVLDSGDLVSVGTLPKPARDALLAAAEPALGDHPRFAVLTERLAGLNDAGQQGVRPVRLTERERLLLPLLATEDPVPEIARRLHVSVNTVRKQVATLREKFDADSRAELVRRARNYGVLP